MANCIVCVHKNKWPKKWPCHNCVGDFFKQKKTRSLRAGKDCYGYLWYWDPQYYQIWCQGDTTPRDQREYYCESLDQAKEMLEKEEVP